MKRRHHAHKRSKYCGVTWHGQSSMWRARMKVDCIEHHLGLFHDEVDAAKAYDKEAYKLDGDLAFLNFPREDK